MVQEAIEAMLRQKLGLDANSVGSRMIARAVECRQMACNLTDSAAYLALLQRSPQELDNLIEVVVVPETWFFRDEEAFLYLRHFVMNEWRAEHPTEPLRVLSVPCSTGEEPYSIAITLLEAGLPTHRFHIDAVDVSQHALLTAKQAIYRKNSFRGSRRRFNTSNYFQNSPDGCAVRAVARDRVNFIQGNVLDPKFLSQKPYQVIFCRNLLIYLDQAARHQVLRSLDDALTPKGLLFVGAVETSQVSTLRYTAIDHPLAFAYRKEPPAISNPQRPRVEKAKPVQSPQPPSKPLFPVVHSPPTTQLALLDTAKQSADRGQLTQAVQLCESYLRANPTEASAYLLLGEIYQGLNQPRQAEQFFQKAIYLNPNAYEALIHLALLKEQQGDRAASDRLKKRAQRLVDNLT
jgi:chemotaxis protein methyltransferase WspC